MTASEPWLGGRWLAAHGGHGCIASPRDVLGEAALHGDAWAWSYQLQDRQHRQRSELAGALDPRLARRRRAGQRGTPFARSGRLGTKHRSRPASGLELWRAVGRSGRAHSGLNGRPMLGAWVDWRWGTTACRDHWPSRLEPATGYWLETRRRDLGRLSLIAGAVVAYTADSAMCAPLSYAYKRAVVQLRPLLGAPMPCLLSLGAARLDQ